MNILTWKAVKTRKPHKCWGCAQEYTKGTDMIYASYADGGTVSSCYWCSTCERYMYKYPDDDGYPYGSIYLNDKEEWERIKKDKGD